MASQFSSIALFLTLLIDLSSANDENIRATITKRGSLPSFQATASNPQSSSSHSSYHATFSPVIPSASNNKYIYHDSQKSGTVFIAVGSCLGFIILALFGIWLLFAIRAWKSARQEYRLRAMENKYQCDPFLFTGGAEPYESSIDFSDTDDSSDISEKVFKEKSTRMSVYSFGSNSALNLLNQAQAPNTSDFTADPNNASNMFVSPTEMIKNQSNNRMTWNLAHPPSLPLQGGQRATEPNSGSSTPREQAFTQIIGNHSLYALPPALTNSSLNKDNGNSSYDSTNNTQPGSDKVKNYRPPSVHLDTILDQNL